MVLGGGAFSFWRGTPEIGLPRSCEGGLNSIYKKQTHTRKSDPSKPNLTPTALKTKLNFRVRTLPSEAGTTYKGFDVFDLSVKARNWLR